MNRLGVFAYWNNSDVEHDYVVSVLQSLRPALSKLIIVCLKPLNPTGAIKVYADDVLVQEEATHRCYMYGHALENMGWDALGIYDEVLFFDSSFFIAPRSLGCVPLDMEQRKNMDFWALTEIGATEIEKSSICPYQVRPRHVQWYFWAVRRSMLTNAAFQNFWDNMPAYSNDADVLDGIEAVFTYEFEKLGFTWSVFSDTSSRISDNPKNNYDISVFDSYRLLDEQGFPVVRQELFTTPYEEFLRYGAQDVPNKVFCLLSQAEEYDERTVLRWITQEVNLWQIESLMGVVHVVSDLHCKESANDIRMALVAYINDDESLRYLERVSDSVDVFVVSRRDTLCANVSFAAESCVHVTLCSCSDALLFAWKSWAELQEYDVVGFYHDEAPDIVDYPTVVDSIMRVRRSCIIQSADYVKNLAYLFAQDRALGMLRPRRAAFGTCFLGNRETWQSERGAMDTLFKENGLIVPMNKEVRSVDSAEVFWARAESIRLLVSLLQDGRFNRPIVPMEQLMPYATQATGLFTGYLMPPNLAAVTYTSESYMLRAVSRSVGRLRTIRRSSYFARFLNDIRHYDKRKYDFDAEEERITNRLDYSLQASDVLDEKLLDDMCFNERTAYKIVSLPHYNEGISTKRWRKPKRTGTILSPVRVNAIEWLPLDSNDIVLEIGGDYGEYTHHLSKRALKVITVEPNEARRAILLERCKRNHNIEVIGEVGDVLLQKLPQKLNWIIIHNLEGLFARKDELASLLTLVVKRCDVESIVLLCNNKQGFRYATESWFVETGERNANTDSIDLRFAKDEIRMLFSSIGFGPTTFFYPYPDYVFCKTVYTDECLPSPAAMMEENWRIPSQRLKVPGESEYYRDYASGEAFADKANCFIAIASKADRWGSAPKLIRYPSDRKDQFSLVTMIGRDGFVRKRCLSPSSRGHILSARLHTQELREIYARASIVFDYVEYGRETLTYAFVEGRSLHDRLVECHMQKQYSVMADLLLDYCMRILVSHDDGYFIPSNRFMQIFGKMQLPPNMRCSAVTNVDMNLDNIIISEDGTYHVIDCEWVFDFPIPATFVVWRTLFYFSLKLGSDEDKRLQRVINACYSLADINDDIEQLFVKMERNFQRYLGM